MTFQSEVNNNYSVENAVPDISNVKQAAVVSGRYTGSTQKDLTVAVYGASSVTIVPTPTSGAEFGCAFLAYRFRDDDAPSNFDRVIKDYSQIGSNVEEPPKIEAVAADAGPPDASGYAPIYAACAAQHFWNTGALEYEYTIDVFRYAEELATPSWEWIATYEPSGITKSVKHVSLAAQADDLWVFWVEEDIGDSTGVLHGRIITGARTKISTGKVTLSANLLESLHTNAYGYYDLKVDWDEDLYGNYGEVDGLPRVVFVDDDFDSNNNATPDSVPELVGARVALDNYGQPLFPLTSKKRIDDLSQVSGGAENRAFPSFVVNRYDKDRFPSLTPADRGFVRYQRSSSTANEVKRSEVYVDGSGNDNWRTPALIETQTRQPAVAARAFGLPRAAFRDYGAEKVSCPGDVVFEAQPERDRGWPHLEVQRARKDNLFLIHAGILTYDHEELDIYQLLP